MRQAFNRLAIVLLIISVIVILYFSSLTAFQYNPEDVIFVETLNNPKSNPLASQTPFTIITHNLGSGINEQKEPPIEHIINNMTLAIDDLLIANSDFIFLQEIDQYSTRSQHTNQVHLLKNVLQNYGYAFASNLKIHYLAIPINGHFGITNQNLMTLSKYQVAESSRVKLPTDFPWHKEMTAPDDALLVSRLKTQAGPELVLANVQIQDLGNFPEILVIIEAFLKAEYALGNYIILGGDFNSSITSIDPFSTVSNFHNFLNMDNFFWAVDETVATNQNGELSNGFLFSDNIDLLALETLQSGFAYSPQNSVSATFMLK